MTPSPTNTKNRNRFSLILQLASPSKPSESDSVKGRSACSPTVSNGSDAGPSSSTVSLLPSRVAGMTPSSLLPRSSAQSSSSPRNRPKPSPNGSQVNLASEALPPPETTNELDADEKLKLLKKARKLSRILGDMPSGFAAESPGYEEPREFGRSSFSKASARRLKTMSWGSGQPQGPKSSSSHINLLKALVSPRPSVPIPLPTPSLSPVTDTSHAAEEGKASLEQSLASHGDSLDLDSIAYLSPETSARASRRTSVAKLTRHLGEVIPPELVVPANMEEVESSEATHTSSAPLIPPTTPVRHVLFRDKWRRKSLELSSTEPLLPPTVVSSLKGFDIPEIKPSLRRSKSAWTKKRALKPEPQTQQAVAMDRVAVIKDLKEGGAFGRRGALADKQRAVNVRRARKLAKMFGSDPPPDLYQVSTARTESPPPLPPDGLNRDSLVTILSVSRSEFLAVSPLDAKRHSVSTISSTPSFSSPEPSPAPVKEVFAPQPKNWMTDHDQDRPFAPPPIPALARASTASAQPGSLDVAFRQRRLRAAKLSRFFGVDYNDLSQSGIAEPSLPARPSMVTVPPTRPDSPRQDVDVRVNQSGRFWALLDGHDTLQTAEINDVIGKLRQMR
ncbi:hypothetical protein EWM64_g2471 [Hericium alpestre]|uniref:Uncharacterized protein n=1 Tax=Hericium alpestre TaxID=135208 RepID=A0A4Z0A5E6_9AGAM|nr:hypothetical protein EWM64_g2471 [Hericium alpestre]